MAPLHGAGQALEADVVGAAVAAEGDELVGVIQLAPLLHGPVRLLHAGQGGCRVLEGVVDEAVLPRRVGIHEGGDFQAAGGGAHHRLVLRVQGTQHRPHRDGRAAARAHSVAAGQAVLFHQIFFQTICHDCSFALFPDI